jgi:hypothetical protein
MNVARSTAIAAAALLSFSLTPASESSSTSQYVPRAIQHCPYSLLRTRVRIANSEKPQELITVELTYEERDDSGRERKVTGTVKREVFEPLAVDLLDPVAGTKTTLLLASKTGYFARFKPSSAPPIDCRQSAKDAEANTRGLTPLPQLTVDGVKADGWRSTIGSHKGSPPMWTTIDTWIVPGSQIILKKAVASNMGDSTTFFVSDLKQTAPPAKDFQIPEGFQLAPYPPLPM